MLFAVGPNPVTEARLIDPEFSSDIDDRPRSLDHHPCRLFPELGGEFPIFAGHQHPVLSTEDPKGSAVRKESGTLSGSPWPGCPRLLRRTTTRPCGAAS